MATGQQPKPKVLLFDIGGVCVSSIPFSFASRRWWKTGEKKRRHDCDGRKAVQLARREELSGTKNHEARRDATWILIAPPLTPFCSALQVVSPFQAILDYERANSIPVGYVNYSIRALTPHGAWHKLERGEIANDTTYFRMFKADLERPDLWARFHREKKISPIPPVPSIDAESLYWNMMSCSRVPDPWMFPALKKLRASGVFKVAALSNTTVFPEGHPFNEPPPPDFDVRRLFEVFVSSAHVGMRKPNRDIYEYTLKLVRETWGADIQPSDVVFLDDIGENLKTAKGLGFRTIRVVLGKTKDAVRELEKATGLELVGEPFYVPEERKRELGAEPAALKGKL